MAMSGNVYMDCATDEDFAFVKIQTLSGHVHPQAVKVVTIQTERTGKTPHSRTEYRQPLDLIFHALPASRGCLCRSCCWEHSRVSIIITQGPPHSLRFMVEQLRCWSVLRHCPAKAQTAINGCTSTQARCQQQRKQCRYCMHIDAHKSCLLQVLCRHVHHS